MGVDGTISINELEVNPAESLEELPAEVIDIASSIAQNLCQQGEGSEFIVTGKGALVSLPSQIRHSNISEVDLVEPVKENEQLVSKVASQRLQEKTQPKIVEAQGWIVSDRGKIELVADSTDSVDTPSQSNYDRFCTR